MGKAILVTVNLNDKKEWPLEERAEELKELVVSSGARVEAEILCSREKPTPDYFIGKGKLEELVSIFHAKRAGLVIFNNDLNAVQLRNLEKALNGAKVIDRTQLILDIFARHAKSMEGKVQVELAQLEYLLPRLTGKGIHLSRLGGGIGTSGPGEKVLEYDRRRLRDQIGRLKAKLKDIENNRAALRKRRQEGMIPSIAIIGYTNAGKTTLLNRLTSSNKLVQDKLFSTLDPVARSYILSNGQKVVFLDTVGFLHNLPHKLIESFKATLEEVKQADLVLHVLDASSAHIYKYDDAVYQVLKELGAENQLKLTALNKVDLVKDMDYRNRLKKDFKDAVMMSALTGEGIELLIDSISSVLSKWVTKIKIEIPNSKMDLVNLVYENGKVNKREDRLEAVYLEALVPVRIKEYLEAK